MNQESSYGDLQDIVSNQPGSGSAAEAHGLLAGLLCADGGIDRGIWLESVFGPDEAPPAGHDLAVLTRLFEDTRQRLEDFDFSFDPLLPADDSPLAERAQALAEWCRGFLAGLGYAAGESEWPGECTEILRDFVEITRLESDASGETDETAYAELSEYVRLGVLLIHSELQSGTPQQLH